MASQRNSLIENIKSKFDKESQISELSYCVQGENLVLFYIDTLIDKKLFSDALVMPLEKFIQKNANYVDKSTENDEKNKNKTNKNNLLKKIKDEVIGVSAVEVLSQTDQIMQKLFSGCAIIVGENQALSCPVYGLQARSVEEPPTSRVVKGPREGFVEDLPRNIGLIRKRLKTSDLKIKELFVGERTHTQVSILYLDGIAKPEVIAEVEERISKINIDGIIDSYYIESFLEGDKLKFFRRVGNSEKPDVICSKLLEGRVAIVVDGSPVVLTVPFMLFENLQSPEDYYTIPAQATFVRIMRIVGLIFAILIPGVYVALQSFNYRILPINFLITLLSSIEGLSVPPLVELLVVLFLFEIITEASLQMPNSLGMALSIIGALALGNTAVDAGIISPPSIVIVAISSVALYIIPDQIAETRILRVLYTLIGGIIGLYGVVVSFIFLTTYLTHIKSFGVPYFAPIAPNIKSDKKDAFIKQPIQEMHQRPELLASENKVRQTKQDLFEDDDENGDDSFESENNKTKSAKIKGKSQKNSEKSYINKRKGV